MKGILKSIGKGAKYAGLAFAAGAVGAVAQDLPGVADYLLNQFNAPELLQVVLSAYGVPYGVSALGIAIQQIIRHRDEIFNPPQ